MVHTATLTYPSSSRLYERFKSLADTKYRIQKTGYYNTSLSQYGIDFIKAHIIPNFKVVFTLRINFKQVISQNPVDYMINVLEESDVDAVRERFNELMLQLMPYDENDVNMPMFDDWYVNRIDYCLNVRTPYVNEYIRLLNKSDTPYYCRDKVGNSTNKNYDGSLYLISASDNVLNRSSTINFYDKHKHLTYKKSKGDDRITDEVLEHAKGILRLEVQCHKTKTDRIASHREKYGFGYNGKKVSNFLTMQICHDVVEESLNRVTKYAMFQRRKIAKKMIDKLQCRQPKKEALQKLIDDVNTQRQSISAVRNRYITSGEMKKETFNSYLKYLEDNNINAVTISDNTVLEGKKTTEGLLPVYDLFFDTVYGQYHTTTGTELNPGDDIRC